jgi:hypothetical protein
MRTLTAQEVKEIRRALKNEFGAGKYRITSHGSIEVYGDIPNTDFSGWYHYGYLGDRVVELMLGIS